MKIGLIGYDFPHAKTNDFIVALQSLGYPIDCVLAAPKKNLKLPKSHWRSFVKREVSLHPRLIAESYGIPYYSTPHNSKTCEKTIRDMNLDLGIISGARILSNRTIKAFKRGIINFHDALIPENRGLDTIKWAVYLDIPMGVTAHFIDHRVDCGRIIKTRRFPVYLDDTIFDLRQRSADAAIGMMDEVMKLAMKKPVTSFQEIGKDINGFRSIMPEDIAVEAIKRFPEYKRKWANE